MALKRKTNTSYESELILEKIHTGIRIPQKLTRSKDFFHVPYSRLNVVKNSPINRAMKEYNDMLLTVEDLDFTMSLNMFRKKVLHSFMPTTLSRISQ